MITDRKGFSRRQFLPRAAAAVTAVAAGVVGYELPHGSSSASPHGKAKSTGSGPASGPAPAAPAPTPDVQSFLTRPDLHPPVVRVTPVAAEASQPTSPRFIFIAPTEYVRSPALQQGLMILDRQGRMVWWGPVTAGKPFDLDAQSLHGQPVLTWWQGTVLSAHGSGVGEIADDSYRTIKAVRAGHGLTTDLHELKLTSSGTALVTAYESTTADLSALGGPHRSPVFAGHVQEIDLTTGKILFDWNSLQHIPIAESQQPLPRRNQTYDYFHLNSIDEMDDGNLLISGRNTWALYKVDRSTGAILWRLGGKRSDFSVPPAATFHWQHDASAYGPNEITVFDNARVSKNEPSRALLLSVDTTAKSVELKQAYEHPAAFNSGTLGSVQLLHDGRVFVGWGDQPYFSEFAADGTLLLDGQLPVGVRSYRAFTADWVGHPSDRPRIVARANPATGFVIHASWNGATEIDHWTVLGGAQQSSLAPVGSQQWSGFETVIAVKSKGPYFCAVALDEHNNELGRSEVV
ncbi:MAG: arylsulfotransferase family protein [Solirubrobacteraceae bacterium]